MTAHELHGACHADESRRPWSLSFVAVSLLGRASFQCSAAAFACDTLLRRDIFAALNRVFTTRMNAYVRVVNSMRKATVAGRRGHSASVA